MKKFFKIVLSITLCIIIAVAVGAIGLFAFYTPFLTADMSVKTGDVTNGASGYLYGIAQKGVPSKNMTDSINISTVAQKVTGGLQHPIGDVEDVASQLDDADYIVVYLQDAYSTWYYEQENIEKMRSEGTYDYQKFITEDYFPKVREAVNRLSRLEYSDRIVYCIYNECDNGVWFGETKKDSGSQYGVRGDYNDAGAKNFFDAWKQTYDLVKSIAPDALIGGPGFCDYNEKEINDFMSYCVENDCVAQIMIYHELVDDSVYQWQNHTKSYRELEKKLGIEALPIIVTEYGRMQDNGIPGKMLQYITQIETSKVYADNAYWRLANNLCDVSADDNSPNSNWWLYYWYTHMQGQTVDIKYHDLFKSNLGKSLKGKAEFSSQGFMGIVTRDDESKNTQIICGGRNGSAKVKLDNIDDMYAVGTDVKITIEQSVYKGISGIVNSPVTLKTYCEEISSSQLVIDMNDIDEANAYHIIITPTEDASDELYNNENGIVRYEFESGELLGNAYTYDSAYATTGDKNGMVGGMENDGDGVSLTFSVPQDGVYNIDIIYGNANDGEYDENGRQNPDDRKNAISLLTLDGENKTEISFENTIKSEYTNCMTMTYELTAGEHTFTFEHSQGTITLDSMLVSAERDKEDIAVLFDNEKSMPSLQSYIVVAPFDAYFDIEAQCDCKADVNSVSLNIKKGNNIIYLMRGLNYINMHTTEPTSITAELSEKALGVIELTPSDAQLTGSAVLKTNEFNVMYIDEITCNSGKATFNFNAEKSGKYALTLLYSNNEQTGNHAYNVDLIERYVTINTNATSQDIYCRNTYSWDTFRSVTCFVELKSGDNIIELTNSGNNKFDNNDTKAPYIALITLSEISSD